VTVTALQSDGRGVRSYDAELPEDLVLLLQEAVARDPQGTAFIDDVTAITWAAFGAEVDSLAGRLVGAGVEPGSRLAVLAGNGIPFTTAVFAGWAAGAIVVPLNFRLTAEDLAELLGDSGTTLFLAGPGMEPLAAAAVARLEESARPRTEAVDHDRRFLSAGEVGLTPTTTPGSAAPAAIMYTSGTTGRPKGVVISHANALQNSVTCVEVLGRISSDRELIMVPQFNVTGLCSQTIPVVRGGLTGVLLNGFDAHKALAAISEHGVTSTVGAPTMWWRLLESAEHVSGDVLAGLRLALFGGAPMSTALLERMRRAMPSAQFGNGYGMTETCSMVTYIGGSEVLDRPDSVGKPLPLTDVRLVSPTTGELVPNGEPGEVVVRGGQVALGYWRADGIQALGDAAGWVHTGDIAAFDSGYLVLRDRLKDVIKRGGESIFSFEVENCIAQHPAVMDVAVVGVPDEQYGERVIGFVVTKAGTTVDSEDLRVFCRENLARFKVPSRIELVSELPRNAGGKVLKAQLRDR
jgi:fatty-acyl-CoA synthase